MDLTLPRVLQRPSPNYTPVPITHDLLILHMMEGGYSGSVVWCCSDDAGATAHLFMSEAGDEVSQTVGLQFKAWAECSFNGRGISLEVPGKTADGIPQARWMAAAKIFGWLCVAYNIPAVWAKGGQGRGICQHNDLGAGGGGHVDCSPVGSNVWLTFIGYVQVARAYFASLPTLPPFALEGRPAAFQVAPLPAVPPEPSHGGAARVAPAALPTDPVERRKWIQARVGVAVDGLIGLATEEAIANYIAAHP